MKICILHRTTHEFGYEDLFFEEQIAAKYFDTYNFRTEIPERSLVIGRYSCLPYYSELEKELALKKSVLVNSYEQHRYIADITNWYEDVKDFTPETFTEWSNLADGKWIVKGKTHSRKHQWKTHMFADGREQLMEVIKKLMDDLTISQDGLVVRKYVPLKRLDTAINDLPIVNEYRLFFYKENYVTGGFYWSNYYSDLRDKYPLEAPEEALKFAKQIAKIVSLKTNFFVLDVAEKENGGWILIEINDGQQSGLSCIEPDDLYKNLRKVIDENTVS